MRTVVAGLLSMVLLAACGRTSRDGALEGDEAAAGISSGAGGAASDGAGGSAPNEPGPSPIDTAGLPSSLPMRCPDLGVTLGIRLPCDVGMNLEFSSEPGYHAFECGPPPGVTNYFPMAFILPLKDVPMWLGHTVALPFADVPELPYRKPDLELNGEEFEGELRGTLTFQQVDLENRAVVAQLDDGVVVWTSKSGARVECSIEPGRLWGVAAGFLCAWPGQPPRHAACNGVSPCPTAIKTVNGSALAAFG